MEWAKNIETSLVDDVNGGLLRDLVFSGDAGAPKNKLPHKLRAEKTTAYLQNLSDQLSVAQGLPESIKITVHYVDQPVINAFATIGGHVFIYQGLIESRVFVSFIGIKEFSSRQSKELNAYSFAIYKIILNLYGIAAWIWEY